MWNKESDQLVITIHAAGFASSAGFAGSAASADKGASAVVELVAVRTARAISSPLAIAGLAGIVTGDAVVGLWESAIGARLVTVAVNIEPAIGAAGTIVRPRGTFQTGSSHSSSRSQSSTHQGSSCNRSPMRRCTSRKWGSKVCTRRPRGTFRTGTRQHSSR